MEIFPSGKTGGYLIIRKKDDRLVWLLDLEEYSPDAWIQVAGERQSGAYEVFYHDAPIFSQNVSSVKWGPWWPGSGPG